MVYLWRAVDHEGEVLESYNKQVSPKVAADFPAIPRVFRSVR